MSQIITIRETNQKLAKGIIPSSLDLGFIPSAEKMEECKRIQRTPKIYEDQGDKLIEEIKNSSPPASKKDRGRSLYVVDDYDEDEESEGDVQYYNHSFDDSTISTRTDKESKGFGKLLKKSSGKLNKFKKAIQSKLRK